MRRNRLSRRGTPRSAGFSSGVSDTCSPSPAGDSALVSGSAAGRSSGETLASPPGMPLSNGSAVGPKRSASNPLMIRSARASCISRRARPVNSPFTLPAAKARRS